MNKARKETEELVCSVMDALDPTGSNSEFYTNLFSKMTDEQFLKFIGKRLPFRFQSRLFKIEPKMDNINKALDILKVPLMETLDLNYLYKNKEGKSIQSLECPVVYLNLKKMKQFITKKNSIHTDMSKRDMKTGRLIDDSKGGQTSDREFESLAIEGLTKTMEELARPKADSIKAKNMMYSSISTTGQVSTKDYVVDIDDSLAKNLLNVYLIGSQLNSNLINQDYLLPYTIANRTRKVEREA